MRVSAMLATAALAVGTALVPVSAAQAATPAPEVKWVGKVKVQKNNRNVALITARYRCFGGRTGSHLWVSVKQGGENLEGEGSSQRARSWYDTNFKFAQDPAGQTVGCNGEWRTDTFRIRRVDGWKQLRDGKAWVQFCVYDKKGRPGQLNSWQRLDVPEREHNPYPDPVIL